MNHKKTKKYFPALGYNFLTNFYDLIMKILVTNKFRICFFGENYYSGNRFNTRLWGWNRRNVSYY